jgi:antitoxin HigA-1
VPRQSVYEIVNEKRGLSAEMALRLARWSGMTPRFWLGLQERYELETAEWKEGENIEREVTPLAYAGEA